MQLLARKPLICTRCTSDSVVSSREKVLRWNCRPECSCVEPKEGNGQLPFPLLCTHGGIFGTIVGNHAEYVLGHHRFLRDVGVLLKQHREPLFGFRC